MAKRAARQTGGARAKARRAARPVDADMVVPAAGTSLTADFFARPTLVVARELIGKYLVRELEGQRISAVIHETEAYIGAHDLACHAAKGRTARTEPLFGPPGCWYVYFCYGVHWMLNAVTDNDGHPAAVLLRGAGKWIGPGRLTKGLAIDKSLNALPIGANTTLWIEDRGIVVPRRQISRTPRIGVDYAGAWAAKPYRFVWEREDLPQKAQRTRREKKGKARAGKADCQAESLS